MDQPLTLSSSSTVADGQSENQPPRVLILDDQFAIRSLFAEVLTANRYEVSLAKSLEEARDLLGREVFDAVVVDIFLNDRDSGLSLLPLLRELQPNTPTIVISGMASMDNVMEALKAGAYDMLTKPFNVVDMLHVIARAVEKKRMSDENERLLVALRLERDMLEARVREATRDLEETIETLRLLNEQVATMFEMSQTPTAVGSSLDLVRHVFELLRRMVDFDGAFCVVYDVRAEEINLSYADGAPAKPLCAKMTDLLRANGRSLLELAESQRGLPINQLQERIWNLYQDGGAPPNNVMLMPLYVHQTLMGVVGLIRAQKSTRLTAADERILGLSISHLLSALEQRNFIARTGQLAGLGELISEIAHDLRHPMTALRGAGRILQEGWRDEDKRTRCINEIQSNLVRMESLVSELVNFYNPKEMNMVAVDLHALLEKALQVSASLLEQKSIRIERHFSPGRPMILGLTRNMIEAFINLIANAVQAMNDGGILRLSTLVDLDEIHRGRMRPTGGHPGGYVLVTVQDNGCGIPEENHEKVFRRFFTTRREGHGLGLSAVQRIVKKNLGHICLESTVGSGTTFYLYLPKA